MSLLATALAVRDFDHELVLAKVRIPTFPSTSAHPTLDALKAETPSRCCLGCDEPLPKKRPWLCGSPECLEVYQIAWYADRKQAWPRGVA